MAANRSGSRKSDSRRSIIVGGTYQINNRIGNGNFGEVRRGKNINNNTDVAVKIESTKADIPQLHLENRFYQMLDKENKGVIGLPKVYFFGVCCECKKCEQKSDKLSISSCGAEHQLYNALVMDLLGPNLEELFDQCHRKFTLKTVIMIAIQLIDRLQYVHDHKIAFRDIKPENFVVGSKEESSHIIHIIDFGLAKQYIDPSSNKHIPFKDRKSLTGTARYMSINTHLKYEQSRRDDLEALGHMLVYLSKGRLPWQGLQIGEAKARYQRIGEIKQEVTINKLCEDLAPEFGKYITYARHLGYDADPDYAFLKNLFVDLANRNTFKLDWVFDWTGGGGAVAQLIPEPPNASLSPMPVSMVAKMRTASMNNYYKSMAGGISSYREVIPNPDRQSKDICGRKSPLINS